LAKSGQTNLATMEWEKSIAQWHRALPAEFEADKLAETEQKLSNAKRHVAQQKTPTEEKPR
jgi:hypothetical protein